MNTTIHKSLPRTLVLSFSGIGSDSATGQLLGNLFAGWPDENLFQVYWAHHPGRPIGQMDAARHSASEIVEAVRRFDPQAVYLRPADTEISYCRLASTLIDTFARPLMTHIMDDWSVRVGGTADGEWLMSDLQAHFRRSAVNLTICPEMSEAYAATYGTPFSAIANGVDPAIWKGLPRATSTSPFVLRYCGALAEDMQRQSVSDVAEAVKRQAEKGQSIRFEIYTMPWFQQHGDEIKGGHPSVAVLPLVEASQYPALLASANAVLLCYNFDATSMEYTKYSFANKTPECLASGAPVLTYGPPQIPSIRYITQRELGVCVTARDPKQLDAALTLLLTEPLTTKRIAERAVAFTMERHDIARVRRRFENLLRLTAGQADMTLNPFTREDDISVDETAVVHAYFAAKPGVGTMIDVGGHHGSAFKQFLDDGWLVHAFEPDPNNRAFIEQRWKQGPRFHLSSNAVGNVSGEQLSFYAADQSTGISSLVPFHDEHKEVATVTTIRLDDYLADTDVQDVDFLKIDTEGFDLRVLQGFPWDDIRPKVIECEFEDAKTLKIDYDYRALAQFLVERGYQVFMSEWHPIIRYGVRHQWCRVVPWPAEQLCDESWGNFLAFREPISTAEVEALFMQHILDRNPGRWAPEPTIEPETREAAQESQPKQNPPVQALNPSRATPTIPRSEVAAMPASNPVSNHLRIFWRYLTSTHGIITLILLLLAASAPFLSGMLAATTSMPWLHLVGPVISAAALVHVFAYQSERARFETQKAVQLSRATSAESKVLQALRQRLALMEQDLQAAQSDLQELHKQHLELHNLHNEHLELKDQHLELKDQHLELQDQYLELQGQYLDLKVKLPEMLQLIGDVRLELDADR